MIMLIANVLKASKQENRDFLSVSRYGNISFYFLRNFKTYDSNFAKYQSFYLIKTGYIFDATYLETRC